MQAEIRERTEPLAGPSQSAQPVRSRFGAPLLPREHADG
jgi:hypothetical protein